MLYDIKTVILFTNGMVLVTDNFNKQVTVLSGRFLDVREKLSRFDLENTEFFIAQFGEWIHPFERDLFFLDTWERSKDV